MSCTCRTCTRSIPKAEKSYNCVACGCHMHLEPTCKGLSNVAINGIKELGRNAMLLCNVCIENNERDNFIRNRTVNNLEEKINKTCLAMFLIIKRNLYYMRITNTNDRQACVFRILFAGFFGEKIFFDAQMSEYNKNLLQNQTHMIIHKTIQIRHLQHHHIYTLYAITILYD